jgi:tetratricopeptide (TPR) repeat protein
VASWLGLAHSALGNHPAALVKAQEAVDRWQELDEPGELAAALLNRGIVLAEAGQPAGSLASCAEAGEIYQRLATSPGQASALLCQARALADQGKLRRALAMAEQSVACVESLWEELEGVGQGLFYRQSKASYYETLIDILMQLGAAENNRSHAARALAVSEQTHFRSLLASLTALRNGLRNQVDPSLAAQSTFLRRRLNVLRQDLAAACFPSPVLPGEAEKIVEVNRQLESARAELAQVERDIGRRSRRYEALTQPRLLGLAGIQAVLDASCWPSLWAKNAAMAGWSRGRAG